MLENSTVGYDVGKFPWVTMLENSTVASITFVTITIVYV